MTGYGIIIKDFHGRIIDGYSGTIGCSSPIVVEAKALLTAINLAVTSGYPTVVESDCLNLVDALRRNKSTWPWQCSTWLQLMTNLLRCNPHVRVSFTPRAHNTLADRVAKAAATGLVQGDWSSICSFLTL
ncbi:hypothetical protein LINPERHAP2_LOCUS32296 [Linum perenne]